MKKNLIILAIVAIIIIAAKPIGELVGVSKRNGFNRGFVEANPFGMVFIKRGSFIMGANDQSPFSVVKDKSINVTVDAFWMDDTEITNDEYKQFVVWVRDSIIMRTLIQDQSLDIKERQKYTTYNDKNNPFDQLSPDQLKEIRLNWNAKITWSSKDTVYQRIFKSINYQGINELGNKPQLDPGKLMYTYEWINYDQAALAGNKLNVNTGAYPKGAIARVDSSYINELGYIIDTTINRPLITRKDLISNKIVKVYPDTIMWIRDFQYSYNDPKMRMYFSHPGFKNYPVVGVTWEQAQAFCNWRTELFNSVNSFGGQDYRLPTEAEWEYAARGSRRLGMYPWGGNYLRDSKGCYLANFKPTRGSYTDDTGATTMKVASFMPNDYGLFDMAGNVSEWTSTAYVNAQSLLVADMNPNFQYSAKQDESNVLKRKVVKGGSWKDIGYYLQCGVRTYEYQYESRPYIGFRCVRSFNGD